MRVLDTSRPGSRRSDTVNLPVGIRGVIDSTNPRQTVYRKIPVTTGIFVNEEGKGCCAKLYMANKNHIQNPFE